MVGALIYNMNFLLILPCFVSTFAAATEGNVQQSRSPSATTRAWYDDANYKGQPSNRTDYNYYYDQCLLWNKTCSGDRTLALQNFFWQKGTLAELVYGACDEPEHDLTDPCRDWLAPPPISLALKSWMRQPDCLTSFVEWHSAHLDEPPWSHVDWYGYRVTSTIDWNKLATTSTAGCCDFCAIWGGNVDVYYWPAPGARSDCLSTIGTSYRPVDEGFFTTDERGNKWPLSRPDPYTTNSNSFEPVPMTISVSVKRLQNRSYRPLYNISMDTYEPNSPNKTLPGSIAIIGEYTLTSPTVYVGFTNLEARDRCGSIGSHIDYTLLHFQAGELSTLHGPDWQRGLPSDLTRSFNLADLPCPPEHVMTAHQYKPSPGAPYRPVLAPPAKLRSLQPGWENCRLDVGFQGIDPPTALTTVSVPGFTTQLPPPSVSQLDPAQPGQSPPLPPGPTMALLPGSQNHARPDTELLPNAGDTRHSPFPDPHDPAKIKSDSIIDSDRNLKPQKIAQETPSPTLGIMSQGYREPSERNKPMDKAASQQQADVSIKWPDETLSTGMAAGITSGQDTAPGNTADDKYVETQANNRTPGNQRFQQGSSTLSSSLNTKPNKSPPQSTKEIHSNLFAPSSDPNRPAQTMNAATSEESNRKSADHVLSGMRVPSEQDPVRTASVSIASEMRQSTALTRVKGNETSSCCDANVTVTGTQSYFTGTGAALLAKGIFDPIWRILACWGFHKLLVLVYDAL